MQKLLSKMRQAINDYNLIEDGDKIAVGLSGGKDSLTLLHLLNSYKKLFSKLEKKIILVLYVQNLDEALFITTQKN